MTELKKIKYSVVIPVKEINSFVIENFEKIQAEDRRDVEVIVLPNTFSYSILGMRIIETGKVGPAK